MEECSERLEEQLKECELQLADYCLSDDPDILEKTITLEHRIERISFHLEHLEYMLSAWESDTVNKQQIKSIRDALNEFIDENENEDYYENEDLYEEAGINTENTVLIVDDDLLNSVSDELANEKHEEVPEKVPVKEGEPLRALRRTVASLQRFFSVQSISSHDLCWCRARRCQTNSLEEGASGKEGGARKACG